MKQLASSHTTIRDICALEVQIDNKPIKLILAYITPGTMVVLRYTISLISWR